MFVIKSECSQNPLPLSGHLRIILLKLTGPAPKILSTKSFVHRAIERCSTQMYHALKGQHLTFSTHYQPYPHHTPNVLDLLPKWLHGSEIQKSRKVDFSTFSSNLSKFRFIKKFLVPSTIRTLHIHMYWIMLILTH